MTLLQLLGLVVGQLALIAKDPALGYRGQALTEALGLLGAIAAKGEPARAELEALAAQVQAMVADGNREPHKTEWQGLRDLSRKHHEILNPPPPPQEPAEGEPGPDDDK